MFIGNSQKEARYLSFPVFIAVWFIVIKITADILITFAGYFFTEEIEDTVAIMLFKLKSVLYPPDVTAINRRRYKITRFFLAFAYEH